VLIRIPQFPVIVEHGGLVAAVCDLKSFIRLRRVAGRGGLESVGHERRDDDRVLGACAVRGWGGGQNGLWAEEQNDDSAHNRPDESYGLDHCISYD
jgi:hypothetical protein